MKIGQLGHSLRDRAIHDAVRPLRAVDSFRNLRYLTIDYLTLFAILAITGTAIHFCPSSPLGWLLTVVIGLVAIILIGGVQHRVAVLGHEAAHFSFLSNRFWNDLIADFFCMFPVFATLTQYRLMHLAHHQFTNDWDRDPDLAEIGLSKGMHNFPMERGQFIRTYFVHFFWPPRLFAYLRDVLMLSTLGQGRSPYVGNQVQRGSGWLRGAGLVTVFGTAAGLAGINHHADLSTTSRNIGLVALPLAVWAISTAILWTLPITLFFQSPIKQPYSPRFLASLRIAFFMLMLSGMAWTKAITGITLGGYYILFWILPLLTSFPYYMLLRDVYQHANADEGLLTNTRVFFADPFSRWAIFVYGQNLHLPHHLFPAVPHYNLLPLHRILEATSPEYAEHATVCHGTFHNNIGMPTILDAIESGTREPATEPSAPTT